LEPSANTEVKQVAGALNSDPTTVAHTAAQWLDAALESCTEILPLALGCQLQRHQHDVSFPRDGASAFVALVGDASSVQIGVSSSRQGCQNMAKALLSLAADSPDFPDADLADAVGEIVNMIAGRVRAIMAERGEKLIMGIPVFVHGYLEKTESMEVAVAAVALDSTEACLFALKNRK
jgi:CheY-specific phosphatase CheX